MRLGLVIAGIVGVNIISGLVLKTMADQTSGWLITAAGFSIIFVLNGVRLVVWMVANRHFPLSTTYPLTSIFFPIMLVISYAYGDTVSVPQILGTLLITAGVGWLGWRIPLRTPGAQGEAA